MDVNMVKGLQLSCPAEIIRNILTFFLISFLSSSSNESSVQKHVR